MKKSITGSGSAGNLNSSVFLLLLGLFFLSGMSGLVYEIVWNRMLVVVLGNTTIAVSSILVAFMTGLAAGSFYWARKVEQYPQNGLKIFAFLEIATGVCGILLSFLIGVCKPVEGVFAAVFPDDFFLQFVGRIIFSTALLFIPAFFMGGTLAVLSRVTVSSASLFAKRSSLLYGINTLGGVVGAVLGGFFFLSFLGASNSLYLAAACNFLIGAAALLVERLGMVVIPDIEGKRKKRKAAGGFRKITSVKLALFCLLFIAGMCSMGYQVTWTRLLILVIDNSVYSFTIILVGFLTGIGLGGLLNSFVSSRVRKKRLLLGSLQFLIALSAFILPFFIHLKPRAGDLVYLDFLFSHLPFFLLIPTLFMGVNLPLAASVYHEINRKPGESMGLIYGTATIGGVAGIVLVCFLLVSGAGLRNIFLLLAGLQILGGLLFFASLKKKAVTISASVTALAMVTLFFLAMDKDYIRGKYEKLQPDSQLLYFDESLSTTAAVFRDQRGMSSLFLNGIAEVDDSLLSAQTFYLMGALPGLLHEKPENGLMVTFGAGITANMSSFFTRNLDCVDLADQAAEVAGYFHFVNNNVQNLPSVHIIKDDARHYMQVTKKRYSFIVSDATHPRVYDSWVLFTREFYRLVEQRLEENGIFLQWLPFHGLTTEQYMRIVKTFHSVFPHTSLWRVGDAYSVLLGTSEPLKIDFQQFFRRSLQPGVREALNKVGFDSPLYLLALFGMGEENIRKMTENYGEIMTDNAPGHLFFPLKSTFAEQFDQWPLKNYQEVRKFDQSIVPHLENISNSSANEDKIITVIKQFEMRNR